MDAPETRRLVNQIVLKLGDVSNPAKNETLSGKWTELIMQEFYLQGDKEAAQGRPVSMFMDRNTTSVPKCQIGFISFIVEPLWTAAAAKLSLDRQLDNIKANKERWERALAKEQQFDQ